MIKIEPIQTQVGFLHGRDCIFLDDVVKNEKNELIFTGELNGSNCTQNESGKRWIPYQAKFNDVIAYQYCELDTYENINEKLPQARSSFHEITDSDLLNKLDIRHDYSKEAFHHYQFWTYDEVDDIIAESYNFVLEQDDRVL